MRHSFSGSQPMILLRKQFSEYFTNWVSDLANLTEGEVISIDIYVLSLKGNQGKLHEHVSTYFTSSLSPEAATVNVDVGHGRIETHTIRVTNEIACSGCFSVFP